MASLSLGDLVWVRMGRGTHEEPATVTELNCETDGGLPAVRCKLEVSYFEALFEETAVRPMTSGRGALRSRKAIETPGKTPLRSLVTPSPTVAELSRPEYAEIDSSAPEQTGAKRKKQGKASFARKKSKTSATTSPHFAGSKVVVCDVLEAATKKPPSQNKSTVKATLSVEDSSDDEPLSSLRKVPDDKSFNAPKSAKKKIGGEESVPIGGKSSLKKVANIVDNYSSDSDSDCKRGTKTNKSKSAGTKNKATGKKSPSKRQSSLRIEVFESIDSGDESENEDRPFKIEYSPTGRATCRRCDEVIEKGCLRVSHVPLFRGKPGFTVYRHLRCAVFSEEILAAEDVGGWRKLKKDDYEALALRVEESKEEIRQEMEELDPDELVPVSFQGQMRPSPKGLTATLLPFQVEGVSWMHHQEVTGEAGVRGGMLADEMGMGKTIQTITTILDNRAKLQHSKPGAKHPPDEKEEREVEDKLWCKALDDWKHEMVMNNIPKSILPKASSKHPAGGARAGTLVICPVIALSQWMAEIEKFTHEGALKVGIYHGPNRTSVMPRDLMCKYDVVLTTYQVLEADFRKMTSPNKIKCPNCGGKFKIDKLRVHLKYFCGEGAQRTEAQARQRRSRDEPPPVRTRGRSSDKEKTFKKSQKKTSPNVVKRIKIRKVDNFDSESELSDSRAVFSSNRTSRRAAVAASKRMSDSRKEWGRYDQDDTDSDIYEHSCDSSEDESLDSEQSAVTKKRQQTRKLISTKTEEAVIESESDDSSFGADDVARVRRKQAGAFALASRGRKVGKQRAEPKKNFKKKNAERKKPVGPTKKNQKESRGRKKVKDYESEESLENSDTEDSRDPLNGIDMDALMEEAMAGSTLSVLHSFCWWRIILDEAHFIKSRSSQTANAAFALISINRWCLSGTPLQNRVGEFYSLIRFLRIDPMAHYFCRAKDCNCKSLHYRMMNGKCQDCGHASSQHFSHFNKHVLNPIQRSGYSGDGRRAMFTLKREILDKSLLRRTKENRAADMKLPPRIVSIRSIRLHPIEEDFYNALYTQTQSSFNDYVAEGTLLNNYAHIFDLLMRMRQAVDHPYLVVYPKKDSKTLPYGQTALVNNGVNSTDCGICDEPPSDAVISSCCNAIFCRSCVEDYMSVTRQGSIPCPNCRAPFTIDLTQQTDLQAVPSEDGQRSSDPMPSLKELSNVPTGSILRRINLAEFATSTKIEALVEELVQMRESSPGSKAIVFSQFVNCLDLVRWRIHSDPCLKEMGLGALALHGGMDVKARDASLKDFREDPNVRVLLMSLKAGGVALNLTVANYIYLMDAWWNPAAEYQAIDRTHRLGQYRPIRAVRFIAENTVEERVLQLQEKKRLVFDGTIGRDAGSLQMLTVEDMKALFA